jgi:hypothetical protein
MSQIPSSENCSVNITPAFQGQLTASDLLQPEGTMAIPMLKDEMLTKDGILFSLRSNDYCFTLELNSGCLILTRCRDQIILTSDLTSGPPKRIVWLAWSPNQLKISCGYNAESVQESSKETAPTYPQHL